MEKNLGRRSGSVADRRVQFALVKRVLYHWCIFMVTACFVALVTEAFSGANRGSTWSSFLSSFWLNQAPFFVVAVFLLPIFLVDTNKVSHKFAGPMIRFRRAMRDVAKGKVVNPIKFRPGDFWHDIANDFNAMTKRLGKHISDTHAIKDPSLTGEEVSADAK